MTRSWGPKAIGEGIWRFALWAPSQLGPFLEIADQERLPMEPGGDGWFICETQADVGASYRFHLDDGSVVPDPASRVQRGGVHGWSVVCDPAAWEWNSVNWRGRPWSEAVIMEVHVGLCGGFTNLAAALPRLADIGITAIELMPVNAFPGTRGWGYDGVLPFAPFEGYGTPEDLHALVDRAHALGMMVFLDVVYNHFGPEGNYLSVYAPQFFHAEAHTPWGGAIAVDEPAVAAYFLQNALMWLSEYQFDGLRFDAVHALENNGFLDWLAQEIRAELPDRYIHLILENEHNDAQRLSPGGYDAQWNDDFHNVLHVLLTGETSGYYQDFADRPAERLARCLSEGFIYQGEASPNLDGKPRGSPSGGLPPTAFVGFLQNHDQIGNRAMGERLVLLADEDKLRAATALLLLSPHIPLLFMGEEQGSRSPFLFFTDFHDELADAVREGRRKEFAKFKAFQDEAARMRIPDPNAEATFAASKVQPGADAAMWETFYTRLLALRAERIAPFLNCAISLGAQAVGEKAVQAAWRLGNGATLTVYVNFGPSMVVPSVAGECIFTLDAPGEPPRFAAWISNP